MSYIFNRRDMFWRQSLLTDLFPNNTLADGSFSLTQVEGGKSSSDTSVLELETLGNSDNVSTNFDAKKRNISSTDLSCSMFQELYDAIDSHQFDVSVGAEVQDLLQEEWFGTFTKCLNAGDWIPPLCLPIVGITRLSRLCSSYLIELQERQDGYGT